MGRQLYFEDVEVGADLPPLEKKPTTQTLVKWAGASGDYYQIHYDDAFARGNGLPGVIVHGALRSAWLGQFVNDWSGEGGELRKLSCSHRGMDVPGDTITCKGKVTNKYVKEGEHYVECEVWTENTKGERTSPGSVVVVLPTRG